MIDGMSFPIVIRDTMMTASREADGVLGRMSEDDFCAFYERTARPLWSYLSRITGNPQQADDLLQEAYYRFYRAGAAYESEAHRRNSLFQIATNLVRDAARRSSRHHDVALEEDESSPLTPKSEVPAPDQLAAIRTDLSRAMEKLEPVQREMLWLAYAQGVSHEEIAAILGLRAVSIRTLLLRARRKLAGLLAEQPAGSSQESRQ
jgi:RNA polymerase sigma-70 factor, ECF subfamily